MAAAVDGTVVVDSGQSGVYGGTPSVFRGRATHGRKDTLLTAGSPNVERFSSSILMWFVFRRLSVPSQSPRCPKRISALPHDIIWGVFVIKSCYDIHEDLVLKAHLFWFHVSVSIFKRKIKGMQLSFHCTSPSCGR